MSLLLHSAGVTITGAPTPDQRRRLVVEVLRFTEAGGRLTLADWAGLEPCERAAFLAPPVVRAREAGLAAAEASVEQAAIEVARELAPGAG